jgi:hypothetical protein
MQKISVNGLTIETDKSGMSMSGEVVVFNDGSTYNRRTGAFNNAGPGYVKVNGKKLDNSAGDPAAAKSAITKKSCNFAEATHLSLKLKTADVVVEKHDKDGIRVEITGLSNLVEAVKLDEQGSTLIVGDGSAGKFGLFEDGGGFADFVSEFSGLMRSGGFGKISMSSFNCGRSGQISIKIFAPKGTPIDVSSVSSDVDISGIDGPLSINIKGSADVKATGASGNVQIGVAGSGNVNISGGNIDNLNVSIAGSGDVKFSGTAKNAFLSIAGSGDIGVARVINLPVKNVAGSGDIRVARIG